MNWKEQLMLEYDLERTTEWKVPKLVLEHRYKEKHLMIDQEFK